MATTTATITLSSADIADNALSISNTATLYTAGTDTGITETTGLARKKFATASEFILLDSGLAAGIAADVTADKSAKVYIKNMNDRGDGTKYAAVRINSIEVGRLYGGDWAFFPWSGGANKDIDIQTYNASGADATETTVEFCVFYE
tara:strand:+ start:885 stop:1325 length:441 start_codon:yes stop_codon:yes gene_type:complete